MSDVHREGHAADRGVEELEPAELDHRTGAETEATVGGDDEDGEDRPVETGPGAADPRGERPARPAAEVADRRDAPPDR